MVSLYSLKAECEKLSVQQKLSELLSDDSLVLKKYFNHEIPKGNLKPQPKKTSTCIDSELHPGVSDTRSDCNMFLRWSDTVKNFGVQPEGSTLAQKRLAIAKQMVKNAPKKSKPREVNCKLSSKNLAYMSDKPSVIKLSGTPPKNWQQSLNAFLRELKNRKNLYLKNELMGLKNSAFKEILGIISVCGESKDFEVRSTLDSAVSTLIAYAISTGSINFLLQIVYLLLRMNREQNEKNFGKMELKFDGIEEFFNKLADHKAGLDVAIPILGKADLNELLESLKRTNFNESLLTKEMSKFYKSVACDGKYFYAYEQNLGISKIGTGRKSTYPGVEYCETDNYMSGKLSLACCEENLYVYSVDNEKTNSVDILACEDLKKKCSVKLGISPEHGVSMCPISLFSEGHYIYVLSIEKVEVKKQSEKSLKIDEKSKSLTNKGKSVSPKRKSTEKELKLKFTKSKDFKKPVFEKVKVVEKSNDTPGLQNSPSDSNLSEFKFIEKLFLYVYEPTFKVNENSEKEPFYYKSREHLKQMRNRYEKAELLRKKTNYYFKIETCLEALLKSDEDVEKATNWLSKKGNSEEKFLRMPLLRRVVLDLSGILKCPNLSSSIKSELNKNWLSYSTGHQVVMLSFAQNYSVVYDAFTGNTIISSCTVVNQISHIYDDTMICYETTNNQLWTVLKDGNNFLARSHKNMSPEFFKSTIKLKTDYLTYRIKLNKDNLDNKKTESRKENFDKNSYMRIMKKYKLKKPSTIKDLILFIILHIDRISKLCGVKIQKADKKYKTKYSKRLKNDKNKKREVISSSINPRAPSEPFCVELEDETFVSLYNLSCLSLKFLENPSQDRNKGLLEHKDYIYILYVCFYLLKLHFYHIERYCGNKEMITAKLKLTKIQKIEELVLKGVFYPNSNEINELSAEVYAAGYKLFTEGSKNALGLAQSILKKVINHTYKGNQSNFQSEKQILLLEKVLKTISKAYDLLNLCYLNALECEKNGKKSFLDELYIYYLISEEKKRSENHSTKTSRAMKPKRLNSLKFLFRLLDKVFYSFSTEDIDNEQKSTELEKMRINKTIIKIITIRTLEYCEILLKKDFFKKLLDSPIKDDRLLRDTVLSLLPPLSTLLSMKMSINHTVLMHEIATPLENFIKIVDTIAKENLAVKNWDKSNSGISFTQDTNLYVFETSHPYCNNSELLKKKIEIKDANAIEIGFDHRCSTKTYNDELKIFEDEELKAHASCVQSGETRSFFGNKNLKGSQMPLESRLLFLRNSLTFLFSCRSSKRLENDKNVWGFKIYIRGLYVNSTPFLIDLSLTINTMIKNASSDLIVGPSVEQDEIFLKPWLKTVLSCGLISKNDQSNSTMINEYILGEFHGKADALIEIDKTVKFSWLGGIGERRVENVASWVQSIRSLTVAFLKHTDLLYSVQKLCYGGAKVGQKRIKKIKNCILWAKKQQMWMYKKAQILNTWNSLWHDQELNPRKNGATLAEFKDEYLSLTDEDSIQTLCQFKKVPFRPDDLSESIEALFGVYLNEKKKNSIISGFEDIANYVLAFSRMLLMFRSVEKKIVRDRKKRIVKKLDQLETRGRNLERSTSDLRHESRKADLFEEKVVPILKRSLSTPYSTFNKGFLMKRDKSSLIWRNLFKNMLRGESRDGENESSDCAKITAVELIVSLLKTNVRPEVVERIAKLQSNRMFFRQKGIEHLRNLFKTIWLETAKFDLFGIFSSSLKQMRFRKSKNRDIFYGLDSCFNRNASGLINAFDQMIHEYVKKGKKSTPYNVLLMIGDISFIEFKQENFSTIIKEKLFHLFFQIASDKKIPLQCVDREKNAVFKNNILKDENTKQANAAILIGGDSKSIRCWENEVMKKNFLAAEDFFELIKKGSGMPKTEIIRTENNFYREFDDYKLNFLWDAIKILSFNCFKWKLSSDSIIPEPQISQVELVELYSEVLNYYMDDLEAEIVKHCKEFGQAENETLSINNLAERRQNLFENWEKNSKRQKSPMTFLLWISRKFNLRNSHFNYFKQADVDRLNAILLFFIYEGCLFNPSVVKIGMLLIKEFVGTSSLDITNSLFNKIRKKNNIKICTQSFSEMVIKALGQLRHYGVENTEEQNFKADCYKMKDCLNNLKDSGTNHKKASVLFEILSGEMKEASCRGTLGSILKILNKNTKGKSDSKSENSKSDTNDSKTSQQEISRNDVKKERMASNNKIAIKVGDIFKAVISRSPTAQSIQLPRYSSSNSIPSLFEEFQRISDYQPKEFRVKGFEDVEAPKKNPKPEDFKTPKYSLPYSVFLNDFKGFNCKKLFAKEPKDHKRGPNSPSNKTKGFDGPSHHSSSAFREIKTYLKRVTVKQILKLKDTGEDFERRKAMRVGPERVGFSIKNVCQAKIVVKPQETIVSSEKNFSSVFADVGVTKGKWYFECNLITNGLMQLGWSTNKFSPTEADSGCGDDEYSWAYDGSRCQIWNSSLQDGNRSYGTTRWKAGDTVGFALDMDSRKMEFYLNGKCLGVAFESFKGEALYPCGSLSIRQKIKFVFNPENFSGFPPNGYYPLENDGPCNLKKILDLKRIYKKVRSDVLEFGFSILYQGTYEECKDVYKRLKSQTDLKVSIGKSKDIIPQASDIKKVMHYGKSCGIVKSDLSKLFRYILNSGTDWTEEAIESIETYLKAAQDIFEKGDKTSTRNLKKILGILEVLSEEKGTLKTGDIVKVRKDGIFTESTLIEYQEQSPKALVYYDGKRSNDEKLSVNQSFASGDSLNLESAAETISNAPSELKREKTEDIYPLKEEKLEFWNFLPEKTIAYFVQNLIKLATAPYDYEAEKKTETAKWKILAEKTHREKKTDCYLAVVRSSWYSDLRAFGKRYKKRDKKLDKTVLHFYADIKTMILDLIFHSTIVDLEGLSEFKECQEYQDSIYNSFFHGLDAVSKRFLKLISKEGRSSANIEKLIPELIVEAFNAVEGYLEEAKGKHEKFGKDYDTCFGELKEVLKNFKQQTAKSLTGGKEAIKSRENTYLKPDKKFCRETEKTTMEKRAFLKMSIKINSVLTLSTIYSRNANRLDPEQNEKILDCLLSFVETPSKLRLESCELLKKKEAIQDRLFDLRNRISRLCPSPFQWLSPAREKVVEGDSGNDRIDCFYDYSSYEYKVTPPNPQPNRMLQYWEKFIIPKIENYVRGSFKAYEMEYFFEQLRQPLRQQQANAAIEITHTLTSGRIPTGIVFPDTNKDWSSLMFEEIRIGQYLLCPNIDSKNEKKLIGRVKCLNPEKETVRMAFFDRESATYFEKWYDCQRLNFIEEGVFYSNRFENEYEYIDDVGEAEKALFEIQKELIILKVKKALFKKATNMERSLICTKNFNDTDSLKKLIIDIVQPHIQLLNLKKLGEPKYKKKMEKFENFFISRLQRIHGNSFTEILLDYLKIASDLVDKKVQKSYFVKSKPTRTDKRASEKLIEISIEDSVGLILIFGRSTLIEKGENSLNVYKNKECTNLVRSYYSKNEEVATIYPLIISGPSCWIKVTSSRKDAVNYSIQVIPISEYLGVSFWIVSLLLRRSVESKENRLWVCLELLKIILSGKTLSSSAPSPIKNAILRNFLQLLYNVKEIGGKNEAKKFSEIFKSKTMGLLYDEMKRLYEYESKLQYTEYFQQLMDLNVIIDTFRPEEERICNTTSIEIDKAQEKKKPEEKDPTKWSCSQCTFMNSNTRSECEICLGPRSLAARKQSDDAKRGVHSQDCSVVFFKAACLHGLAGYLSSNRKFSNHEGIINYVKELLKSEVEKDSPEKRLLFFRNLPFAYKADPNVTAERIKKIFKTELAKRNLSVNKIVVFEDTSQKFEKDIDYSRNLYRNRSEVLHFSPETPFIQNRPDFDKKGIIHYLATEGSKKPFKNPAVSGIIQVSSTLLHPTSEPLSSVVGNKSVRCLTTARINPWVCIKFSEHKIRPTHYCVRHYSSWNTEALRTWRLEAKNEGEKWTVIQEHVDDQTINRKGCVSIFETQHGKKAYSTFRITMFGKNSNSHWYLIMSGFELYGELFGKYFDAPPTKSDTNRYALIEMSSGSDRRRVETKEVIENTCFEKALLQKVPTYNFGEVDTKKSKISPLHRGFFYRRKMLKQSGAPKRGFLDMIFDVFQSLKESKEKLIKKLGETNKEFKRESFELDKETCKKETVQVYNFFKKRYFQSPEYIKKVLQRRILLDLYEKLKLKNHLAFVSFMEGLGSEGCEEEGEGFGVKKPKISEDVVKHTETPKMFWDYRTEGNSGHISFDEIIATFSENPLENEELFTRLVVVLSSLCDDSGSVGHLDFLRAFCRFTHENPNEIWSWIRLLRYDSNLVKNGICSAEDLDAHCREKRTSPSIRNNLIKYFEYSAKITREYSVYRLSPTQLLPCEKLTEQTLLTKPELRCAKDLGDNAVRLEFSIIKSFNKILSEILPLIDFNRSKEKLSLAGLLGTCKGLVFKEIKNDFFDSVINITSVAGVYVPTLVINRLAFSEKLSSGEDLNFEKDTHFGIAMRDLLEVPNARLRSPKPQGTDPHIAFEVIYKDQHVLGVSGPYRQFFSEVSRDIISENCGVFVSVDADNRARSLWTVNPSALSNNDLRIFKTVGILIGCCIRTGAKLSLEMTPDFWKRLCSEEITFKDAVTFCPAFYYKIQQLRRLERDQWDPDLVSELFGNLDVEDISKSKEQLLQKAFEIKISETAVQLDFVKKGIDKVVPRQILNLLKWEELEKLVCGSARVDVAILKRHTHYACEIENCTKLLENFWGMLEGFDENLRRKFVQFTWGHDRLPQDDAEFERNGIRLLINPMESREINPDDCFPKAQTCFFNLELPNYSSRETMEKKFVYAISETVTMNADSRDSSQNFADSSESE